MKQIFLKTKSALWVIFDQTIYLIVLSRSELVRLSIEFSLFNIGHCSILSFFFFWWNIWSEIMPECFELSIYKILYQGK